MYEASDSKLVTREWNNDNSKVNYGGGNGIIYKNEVLKSNLCDYNTEILVRGLITVSAVGVAELAFKKFEQFTKYITKTDGRTIDYAEDLDLVM